MPAVVPIVAAFASGAVGAVVAGTAGLAAYATVAGAVLTGVGALTGKKDLMKIGGVLSLAGGVATAFGGASSAASAVGDVANSAAETAASAAAPAAADAASTAASDAAASAATNGGDIGVMSDGTLQSASGSVQPPPQAAPSSLADLAAQPQAASAGSGQAAQFATQATTTAPTVDTTSRVADMAKGITSNDLSTWWEKAKAMGSKVGDYVEKHPALLTTAGSMLSSMYGPQAEKMDFEKSMYARAQANLNSPVKMMYNPGGKP